MIKGYKNLYMFIKEISKLKDCIVFLPYNIDEQLSRLTTYQLKSLKSDIQRLNIKVIVERDNYDNIKKVR